MKKLDYVKYAGKYYKLPEGYYAIETIVGLRFHDQNGFASTVTLQPDLKGNPIIYTCNEYHELEEIEEPSIEE